MVKAEQRKIDAASELFDLGHNIIRGPQDNGSLFDDVPSCLGKQVTEFTKKNAADYMETLFNKLPNNLPPELLAKLPKDLQARLLKEPHDPKLVEKNLYWITRLVDAVARLHDLSSNWDRLIDLTEGQKGTSITRESARVGIEELDKKLSDAKEFH
jgi:hypothetical protein